MSFRVSMVGNEDWERGLPLFKYHKGSHQLPANLWRGGRGGSLSFSVVGVLLGSLGHCGRGDDGDEGLVVGLLDELDSAVDEGEEGVVLAHAYVEAWVVYGAALTDDDVASLGSLAAEEFEAKSFAFRVTAVLGTADAFLMCHFF